MNKINIGKDLYLKGRIGWKGLAKDEYLESSDYRIINGLALEDKLINWDKSGYITKYRYNESPEIMLKEKDILISKDGTLGKIGYVKELKQPSTVASGIFVMRNIIPEKLDSDYLYHYLKSNIFKNFIECMKASGSTINHLYQRDLSQLELQLPSLIIQKHISRILNDIDAKIELNININKKLEISSQLYFDYLLSKYKNQLIKIKPKQLGKVICGSTPSTKESSYYGTEIPFITIPDMTNNIILTNYKTKLSLKGANVKPKKLLPKGSICISCIATTGLVSFVTEPSQTNQQINSIVPFDFEIKYAILKHMQILGRHFQKISSGSVFNNINKSTFENFDIPALPIEVMRKFDSKVSIYYEKIYYNKKENQELIKLRDLLLPMLMNGQVSVKE